MKRYIKIEEKPNQRIVVEFNPETENFTYTGQFKPKNKDWVNFVSHTTEDSIEKIIDQKTIKDILFQLCVELKYKIDKYEKFDRCFSEVKTIEIT